MILRRIAQHVREQNWTAVAFDFAIVVVGVVIGFQVTAWGQARSDAVRGRAYADQLRADLAASVAQLDRELAIQRGSERAAVRLQRAVYAADRPPEDSLVAWTLDLNYYSDPRPTLGTARALGATGDLLLLPPPLRQAVVETVEEADYLAADATLWRSRLLDALFELNRRVSIDDLIAVHGFTPRLDSLASSRDWLPADRRPVAAPSIADALDDPSFRATLRETRLAAAVLRGHQEQQLAGLRRALDVLDALPAATAPPSP
ncbi:hypothetical protein [Rubrivirga sp. IMCC45206]|uniref:hypothetical protein n=1 Tax=Rubrivirga sp. IMCC45206 TaxID=3391614 RepID=UPI00399008A0